MNDTVRACRNRCIGYLKANFTGQMAKVDEYVEEAENQEGYEYWLQFEDGLDLAADFKLFLEYGGSDE